jgi:hypothetical protein
MPRQTMPVSDNLLLVWLRHCELRIGRQRAIRGSRHGSFAGASTC